MAAGSKTIIELSSTIEVQQDKHTVFNYLADLRLDKHWRKEINETTVSDPELKRGTIAVEDSFLSKRVPNYKAALACTEYQPGASVVYQSLPENAFWLKSRRQVESLAENKTRITYHLQFDAAVVKHGLGFQLPAFFVKYYTRTTMKKYLQQLKRILEE